MLRIKNYENFEGDELKIADLIQRRRLQILIHSCIYYELDHNIITDKQWDSWAKELKKLQDENPDIAEKVCFSEEFKGWDATTGAFLPIREPEIMFRAKTVLTKSCRSYKLPEKAIERTVKIENKPSNKPGIKRLF